MNPLGGRPGSDLVCAAASGLLSTVSGPPGRYHPMPGRQALKVAGETAALAVMHGVSELRAGEPALHLDLSVQEAAAFCSIQQEVSHHLYECGGPAGAARYATPSGLFSCTDGELGIVVLDDHQWVRVAGVLGRPELAEQYPSPAARLANRPVIDQVMREWTAGRSKLECERLLQEAGVAAVALRTPTQFAEEIKIKYACALSQLASPDETIEVPSVGERPPRRLSRQTLAEVVEPRYEELFALIQAELRRSGFEDLIAAGIVLTGGTAKMEGVIELAEEVFHMPVRLGVPQNVSGLADVVRNPIYATGVGLLQFGWHNRAQHAQEFRSDSGMSGLLARMKSWFQGNF